jgi:uncharacterized protein (TIGR00251 family)
MRRNVPVACQLPGELDDEQSTLARQGLMSALADLYDVEEGAVVLHVHVQPGAGRSAVVGRHGGALKIRVAAPPVEGRANEEAAALLAGALEVAGNDVELVGGARSRLKRFRVLGVTAEEVEVQLRLALDAAGTRIGEPRRPPT